jgi:hypothetical protein
MKHLGRAKKIWLDPKKSPFRSPQDQNPARSLQEIGHRRDLASQKTLGAAPHHWN